MPTLKTIQLSDTDLKIIRDHVVPELELIPGSGDHTDEDDEALWTFIDKLKKASE